MLKRSVTIIAIDGPSSSGKGTLAKKLAEKLGYSYLDTGAMYRALALAVIKYKVDVMDEEAVLDMLKKCRITFNQQGHVFLNDMDVSKVIRSQEVAAKIAFIASYPSVRKLMVEKQRACVNEIGAVLDGRDIGTVVFPQARYKFFISASLKERARRRGLEYLKNGDEESFHRVLHDLAKRDFSDIYRQEGPLKKAEDAFVVDTTNLNIEEALEQLFVHIQVNK